MCFGSSNQSRERKRRAREQRVRRATYDASTSAATPTPALTQTTVLGERVRPRRLPLMIAGICTLVGGLATGAGVRLEGTGVQPDVPSELTAADLDAGRDQQLNTAVQLARDVIAEPVR